MALIERAPVAQLAPAGTLPAAPVEQEAGASLTRREQAALASARVIQAAQGAVRALGEGSPAGAAQRAALIASAFERLARAVGHLEELEGGRR